MKKSYYFNQKNHFIKIIGLALVCLASTTTSAGPSSDKQNPTATPNINPLPLPTVKPYTCINISRGTCPCIDLWKRHGLIPQSSKGPSAQCIRENQSNGPTDKLVLIRQKSNTTGLVNGVTKKMVYGITYYNNSQNINTALGVDSTDILPTPLYGGCFVAEIDSKVKLSETKSQIQAFSPMCNLLHGNVDDCENYLVKTVPQQVGCTIPLSP